MNSSFALMTDEGLIKTRETLRQRLSHNMNRARIRDAADVSFELEDSIRQAVTEIDQINAELAKRGVKSDDPAPQAPMQTIINYYGTVHDNRGAGTVQSSGDGSILVGGSVSGSTVSASTTKAAPPAANPTIPSQAAPSTSALQTLVDALKAAADAIGTTNEVEADALQMLVLQARDLRRKAQELQQKLAELPESTPSLAQLKELSQRL